MVHDISIHNPILKEYNKLKALDLISTSWVLFHFSIDKIADKHK